MRHRTILNPAAAAGMKRLLAIALFIMAGSARAGETPPPNFVIILADDLGYGDVSCYNAESKIPTPHLDRLAQEGVRFTDAHSPSAVCTPTRYGLLTGRYPWRSSLKRGVIGTWGAPLIEKDRLTLPAMLRAKGYATAAIGKWHLGMQWPTKDGKPPNNRLDPHGNVDYSRAITEGPTTRGFDTYVRRSTMRSASVPSTGCKNSATPAWEHCAA